MVTHAIYRMASDMMEVITQTDMATLLQTMNITALLDVNKPQQAEHGGLANYVQDADGGDSAGHGSGLMLTKTPSYSLVLVLIYTFTHK